MFFFIASQMANCFVCIFNDYVIEWLHWLEWLKCRPPSMFACVIRARPTACDLTRVDSVRKSEEKQVHRCTGKQSGNVHGKVNVFPEYRKNFYRTFSFACRQTGGVMFAVHIICMYIHVPLYLEHELCSSGSYFMHYYHLFTGAESFVSSLFWNMSLLKLSNGKRIRGNIRGWIAWRCSSEWKLRVNFVRGRFFSTRTLLGIMRLCM